MQRLSEAPRRITELAAEEQIRQSGMTLLATLDDSEVRSLCDAVRVLEDLISELKPL